MPKVIGGLFAVVALAVCIVASIEPWTATVRGMVAYAVGHLFGALWESFTGVPGARELSVDELKSQLEDPSAEDAELDAA